MKIGLKPVVEFNPPKSDGGRLKSEFVDQALIGADVPYCDAFDEGFKVDSRTSLYDAMALSMEAWEVLIRKHAELSGISDCCALFGGYGLSVDGSYWLLPQCCSTLAVFESWEALLDPRNFRWGRKLIIGEGHPWSEMEFREGKIVFTCSDLEEAFFPETRTRFSLDHQQLCLAIHECRSEIDVILGRIETLAPKLGVSSLRHLIYDQP